MLPGWEICRFSLAGVEGGVGAVSEVRGRRHCTVVGGGRSVQVGGVGGEKPGKQGEGQTATPALPSRGQSVVRGRLCERV